MSLKQSRILVRRRRKEVAPPRGYVLNDAFRLWCGLKKGRIVSYKEERRRLENHVIRALGRKQIDEITAPLIISHELSSANASQIRPILRNRLGRYSEPAFLDFRLLRPHNIKREPLLLRHIAQRLSVSLYGFTLFVGQRVVRHDKMVGLSQ